jgi:adenylate kinase family enzyme
MPDDTQLKRVVIIGTSCSGKTTFARNLAQKLGVPHIELDSIFWKPNWTPTPKDEFRNLVCEAIAPETWVLDGNYSAVRDVLWARATTVVWLNFSFRVVGWRALSRTLGNVIYQKPMWSSENKETFRHAFLSRDSILWWVLKTYRRRRRDYPRLFEAPAHRHLQVVVLASPAEAERFLQSLNRMPAREFLNSNFEKQV